METDTMQKSNEFGYSIPFERVLDAIILQNLYVFDTLFHFVASVFRSHKLKELINLIQEAKVDEVESWLKTNIPSKHQVCFYQSYLLFLTFVCYLTDYNHKKTQHTLIFTDILDFVSFCHKTKI